MLTPATSPPAAAERTPVERAIQAWLDGESIKPVLQDHLPWLSGRGLVIRRCIVDSVRYNSREKDRSRRRPFVCVAYRLDMADALGRSLPRQLLYVEVYPRPRFWEPPAPGPGVTIVRLPELDAIVWQFPNDPQLSHLPEVMDPERVKRYLPYDQLPAGLDGPVHAREVRAEVLRYKPETHCAARYDIAWEGDGSPPVFTLFGKTHATDRAGEIHRQIETVWEKSVAEPESFLIARVLGYAEPVRTIWQETLVGTPLLPVIGRGDCDAVLEATGTALAILHETRAESSVTVGIGDQLREMRTQIGALVEAYPEVLGILGPMAARMHEEAPDAAQVHAAQVHGDFIPKNLDLHEGRLLICDFDDFVIGDPVQDVARFMVDLYFLEDRDSHLVTLRDLDPAAVQAMANVFVDAYRSRAPWEMGEEHLRWHWRVQMLAKIHYYFKRQQLRPGFERDLHEMLALLLAA